MAAFTFDTAGSLATATSYEPEGTPAAADTVTLAANVTGGASAAACTVGAGCDTINGATFNGAFATGASTVNIGGTSANTFNGTVAIGAQTTFNASNIVNGAATVTYAAPWIGVALVGAFNAALTINNTAGAAAQFGGTKGATGTFTISGTAESAVTRLISGANVASNIVVGTNSALDIASGATFTGSIAFAGKTVYAVGGAALPANRVVDDGGDGTAAGGTLPTGVRFDPAQVV